MTSLSYADLVKDLGPTLKIPAFKGGETLLECANAYIDCGWWILPIRNGSKNPGSILGAGWPQKSSNDKGQAEIWFKNATDVGIALHTGKSKAFVMDVDAYKRLVAILRKVLKKSASPFQSTRSDDPDRGHYIFALPANTKYSNSPGALGKEWGEIRTGNSVIVAYPTTHVKADVGGRYKWIVSGDVPILPTDIASKLRKVYSTHGSIESVRTLDDEALEQFAISLNAEVAPELLQMRIKDSRLKFATGSRHNALIQLLLLGFTEARAGLYSATELIDLSLKVFLQYKPREEWTTSREFLDAVRWAAAAAQLESEETLVQVRETGLALLQPGVKEWLKAVSNV